MNTQFKVGNIVRLKSSRHTIMTVQDVGTKSVFCIWQERDGLPLSAVVLDFDVLELVEQKEITE